MDRDEAERSVTADQHWAEMRNFIPQLYKTLAKLRLNEKLTEKERVLVRKCVALVMLRVDDSVKEINLASEEEL